MTAATLAHARKRLRAALDHVNSAAALAETKGQPALGELAGAAAEAIADALESLDLAERGAPLDAAGRGDD
jgi:hypothetical protein